MCGMYSTVHSPHTGQQLRIKIFSLKYKACRVMINATNIFACTRWLLCNMIFGFSFSFVINQAKYFLGNAFQNQNHKIHEILPFIPFFSHIFKYCNERENLAHQSLNILVDAFYIKTDEETD